MTFYHDTADNIDTLARLIPLPLVVAQGWLRNEGQAVNNPTNPLNILYYHRAPQIGARGRFAVYRTSSAGLIDAANLIERLVYYTRVRTAVRAWRANPSNATIINVARAIEDSPWAGGHYGGGGSRDGGIVRYVRAHLPPGPVTPPVYWRVVIDGLTPVYDAVNGRLIGHVTRATYTCIRYRVGLALWYRIVAPSTSLLYHRWLPAEPTMRAVKL